MVRLSLKRLTFGGLLLLVILTLTIYWRRTDPLTSALAGVKKNGKSVIIPVKTPILKLEPETEEEKDEEKRGFLNNGFNQFISDRLPLNRDIPDTRETRFERLHKI